MLALAGLVDAGFSGDWQARGVLSDAAADSARIACYTAAAAHVVLTGASAFIAQAKGAGLASAAATLAVRWAPGACGVLLLFLPSMNVDSYVVVLCSFSGISAVTRSARVAPFAKSLSVVVLLLLLV